MKKYILIIALFVTSLTFAQGGYTKPVVTAINVTIADAGAIITATEVENALQENRTAINLNTSKPTGSGTTNTIAKFTGANSLGDSNIFDDGSNVGIGTDSPDNILHLFGSGNIGMRVESTSGGDRKYDIHTEGNNLFLEGVGSSGSVQFGEDGNYSVDLDLGAPTGSLKLLSSGNVGINKTIPTEKLEVVGNIKLSGVLIGNESVDKSNLAVALKTKVALGDVSGTVDIDTSLGIHFTMNMTGNITELTFSNLTNEELKTITLQITGNFTIAQPASVKGNWDGFDGTKTNQIQIYLFDISTPTFSSALLNW